MDAFGSVMAASALFLLLADVLNVVGPLCIGALTSYVVTLTYPVDSELVSRISICLCLCVFFSSS